MAPRMALSPLRWSAVVLIVAGLGFAFANIIVTLGTARRYHLLSWAVILMCAAVLCLVISFPVDTRNGSDPKP